MNIKSTGGSDRSMILAAIRRAESKQTEETEIKSLQEDRFVMMSAPGDSVQDMARLAKHDLRKARSTEKLSSSGTFRFLTGTDNSTGATHFIGGVAGLFTGLVAGNSGLLGPMSAGAIALLTAGTIAAGVGAAQGANFLGQRIQHNSRALVDDASKRIDVIKRWGGHSELTDFGQHLSNVSATF